MHRLCYTGRHDCEDNVEKSAVQAAEDQDGTGNGEPSGAEDRTADGGGDMERGEGDGPKDAADANGQLRCAGTSTVLLR